MYFTSIHDFYIPSIKLLNKMFSVGAKKEFWELSLKEN